MTRGLTPTSSAWCRLVPSRALPPMGWVKRSEALSYYGAASVGINIDARTTRSLSAAGTGSSSGLSPGCRPYPPTCASYHERAGSGGPAVHDTRRGPSGAADRLLDLERNRELLTGVSSRLKQHVLEEYSFEKTAEPLREWAAPDARARLREVPRDEARAPRGGAETVHARDHAGIVVERQLAFYLKNEGVGRTLKRAAGKLSGRGPA